jgi:hypothetical protein
MYYTHTKYMVTDDPYPMYQTISELIEADGEAEELWLNEVVDNQCPTRYFTAVDWVSEEDIDLDITNYIGENTYTDFEQIIYNMDEDETFSYTKADSFLKACIAHNMKKRGLRRCLYM